MGASKSLASIGGRAEAAWSRPQVAYIYRDPSCPSVRVKEISAFLETVLGLPSHVRDEFFVHHDTKDVDELARRLAATRVHDIVHPLQAHDPLFGEVQFERRLLLNPAKRVPAILYDAYEYQSLVRSLLPHSESSLGTLHVAFVHRLLGTFGEDGRYHARTVICGFPSVVSTSGLVEAPSKPEGYYKLKAELAFAVGAIPFEAAKEPFTGQFLDYDDARMTEVAKGYALQAAIYHIAKEGFCDDPACRLFNAHTQSELLAAQIASGKLCRDHRERAERIRVMMTTKARDQ